MILFLLYNQLHLSTVHYLWGSFFKDGYFWICGLLENNTSLCSLSQFNNVQWCVYIIHGSQENFCIYVIFVILNIFTIAISTASQMMYSIVFNINLG